MSYKIVIPVHNEAKNVSKLIDRFSRRHLSSIIMVDDGSTDKTSEIIKEKYPEVEVLRHKINLGKGKSLETGTLKAIKEKTDIIIFMDGDLQHKPEDINRFLRAFKKDKDLDILFGARKIGRTMRLIAFIGNKILTIIINIFFRYFLNDTQCGFRAIRSRAFNKIRWTSPGYSAETEMIINAAKHKLKYKEIPIDTIYLDYYKGTYIFDGLVIMTKILLWKLLK
ncbi:glycosyltransferase family 2 protein [Candidatus Peregrinibacteria bacterium]|nr:glycosyltransferase family 2 protein [Candidatus Peregrinibacteria bacterium]